MAVAEVALILRVTTSAGFRAAHSEDLPEIQKYLEVHSDVP